MNKPQPTHELVVEPSAQCERCLTLYAVTPAARAFLKADCSTFGILRSIDTGEDDAPRLMRIIIGAPVQPQSPAAEGIVYSLHVWPNFDLQQVRAWIESWPHVGVLFEQAINEVIDGHH